MRHVPALMLVGLAVGLFSFGLYLRRHRAVPVVQAIDRPTLDRPTPALIERLDERGQVVESFKVERYEEGPARIIAFVTTDGRRLFLQERWRVRPVPESP